MKNKTCGECKFYDLHGGCNKIKNVLWLHSTNIACIGFDSKNPTNGDKIRQMSNEELAEFFALSFMCDTCPLKDVECIGDGETERTYAYCYDKLFSYLNAPADAPDTNVGTIAESEVEDE